MERGWKGKVEEEGRGREDPKGKENGYRPPTIFGLQVALTS